MCRNLEILFCCLFITTITYGIYRSEFWYYTKCWLAKSQKQAITKLVKMFTCMPISSDPYPFVFSRHFHWDSSKSSQSRCYRTLWGGSQSKQTAIRGVFASLHHWYLSPPVASLLFQLCNWWLAGHASWWIQYYSYCFELYLFLWLADQCSGWPLCSWLLVLFSTTSLSSWRRLSFPSQYQIY